MFSAAQITAVCHSVGQHPNNTEQKSTQMHNLSQVSIEDLDNSDGTILN
jgi:hypothetical protein